MENVDNLRARSLIHYYAKNTTANAPNPKQPIRNIATVHEVNEPDHEIGTNPICEQRRLMMRLHICPVSQEPPLLTHIQTH